MALEFRLIFNLMAQQLGGPGTVVASGGALLHSPAWTQMIADALGQPITVCTEREASSRGAALLALEGMGAIRDVAEWAASMGDSFRPRQEYAEVYDEALERQQKLYNRVVGAPDPSEGIERNK